MLENSCLLGCNLCATSAAYNTTKCSLFRHRVTAHFVPVKGQAKPKTTILMKFDPSVVQRDKDLSGS